MNVVFRRVSAIRAVHYGLRKLATRDEVLDARRREMMRRSLPKIKPIDGVKNIVLVASGKGGVGKSTIAVNLACAMNMKKDKKVGLLDSDIFGPSIPKLMNLSGNPRLTKDDKMIPLMNYDIPCMSMGFLVDEKAAVIWRGLMVMQAMERLLRQVAWRELDVLVVDMPPGTGDVQLSIAQNVPVSGAVLVSTPQDIALSDVRRGAEMFHKVNIPVFGMIENMSHFTCPNCGSESRIFGSGRIEKLTKELNVDIIGNISLDPELSELSDKGSPIVISKPDCHQSKEFMKIADTVWSRLPGK